eukprot:13347616-Alexandrium_andersonii.AAC.1
MARAFRRGATPGAHAQRSQGDVGELREAHDAEDEQCRRRRRLFPGRDTRCPCAVRRGRR